jgi:hypothetical protein
VPLLSTSQSSSQAAEAKRRSQVSPLAKVKYKSQWPAVNHIKHGVPPSDLPSDNFPAVASLQKLHYAFSENHISALDGAFLNVSVKALR